MHSNPIERAVAADKALIALLQRHPHVLKVEYGGSIDELLFTQDSRDRIVSTGNPAAPLRGLPELADNNPLVCSGLFSLPDAASTLALIAIGPLALAGVLLEPPVFSTNVAVDEDVLSAFLATAAWEAGVTFAPLGGGPTGLCVATVIAVIQKPTSLKEIDDLYEERFGRSFFVREGGASFSAEAVRGKPYGLYNLRASEGEDAVLLTIHVMADINGKCGAAQVLHAMNIMAGFEETLGIEA